MFDAPIGYHQLAFALASQEKLAFQGVDTIKWTYRVMPFGPTSGPATFVNFIYNIKSIWKELAKSVGIAVGDTTNTRIIIDNIVSWSSTEDFALAYIQCQLKVCQAHHLSLNLRKSHFFPKQFKYVGIDMCTNGNRHAKLKHGLLGLGQHPNLFVTWQSSLALPSSTHGSFIISNYALHLCATSPSTSILSR